MFSQGPPTNTAHLILHRSQGQVSNQSMAKQRIQDKSLSFFMCNELATYCTFRNVELVPGTIAHAWSPDGQQARASGWGPAFLDGGSAYDLGACHVHSSVQIVQRTALAVRSVGAMLCLSRTALWSAMCTASALSAASLWQHTSACASKGCSFMHTEVEQRRAEGALCSCQGSRWAWRSHHTGCSPVPALQRDQA